MQSCLFQEESEMNSFFYVHNSQAGPGADDGWLKHETTEQQQMSFGEIKNKGKQK